MNISSAPRSECRLISALLRLKFWLSWNLSVKILPSNSIFLIIRKSKPVAVLPSSPNRPCADFTISFAASPKKSNPPSPLASASPARKPSRSTTLNASLWAEKFNLLGAEIVKSNWLKSVLSKWMDWAEMRVFPSIIFNFASIFTAPSRWLKLPSNNSILLAIRPKLLRLNCSSPSKFTTSPTTFCAVNSMAWSPAMAKNLTSCNLVSLAFWLMVNRTMPSSSLSVSPIVVCNKSSKPYWCNNLAGSIWLIW